jgi:two-component system CheB/CheR fusion protein
MEGPPVEIDRRDCEHRVLVLGPASKDAATVRSALRRAGIASMRCGSVEQLRELLDEGAAALLLAESTIEAATTTRLRDWLARQPIWSDPPVIVLAGAGAEPDVLARAMDQLGNITVLESPVREPLLVSTVRAALRARERQYQLRSQLSERERGIEAQALLASIVATSDDAIVSKTLEGNILSWNAGAERLFGYTAEEVIGKSIMIIIPPERAHEEATILSRLRVGERVEHFETQRLTKDGRLVDIFVTVSPVRDSNGVIIGASKIARDIGEKKRAAEALRVTQEQLQVVTDNMAVAVTRCSRDLRYLWVSPGSAAWYGRPTSEIVGKSIREILGTAAFETIHPYIDRVLSGERVEFEIQIPYEHMATRWVKAVYVPTHDNEGLTDGWVAVLVDTTSHHSLEEALREADRRKDEFLAMLAHELRNPLAPIRNSLHILRLLIRNDPTADSAGEMMERQVGHMVRLVDDLMEVSRITRGSIELRKERLEVAAIVRSAVETSRPVIDDARHQLVIAVPSGPLTLEGDPVRLTQVIANLLNNAAKYMEAGGRIWLTIRREGGSVLISVKDTGVGIPADSLSSIFEPFVQGARTTQHAPGGLGIGLTLVKRLVEMHGGSVEARSDGAGRGSEFVVRLPLLEQASAVDAIERAGRRPSVLAARRVLVVDDNRDAAESMRLLLELLGAEVRVAYNGLDALDMLERYRPAVVLLDIGMPDMDGHEVARRIRQHPELNDVTLIALTGWGQDEDRRRSRLAGFDYHLIKPADVRTLASLLGSIDDGPPRTEH